MNHRINCVNCRYFRLDAAEYPCIECETTGGSFFSQWQPKPPETICPHCGEAPWRPSEDCDSYWFAQFSQIAFLFRPARYEREDSRLFDMILRESGNCFRTRGGAQAYADRLNRAIAL